MHYSKYLKRQIDDALRQLDARGEMLRRAEERAQKSESQRAGDQAKILQLENEKRQLCTETSALRSENLRLKNKNEDLEKSLSKCADQSALLKEYQRQIKGLEKKLNIRSGREEVYGLSTPSSRLINKVNSTEENRQKRGGAVPGHEGYGRKVFTQEEAEVIVDTKANHSTCECGCKDLIYRGQHQDCRYDVIPMRIRKVAYSIHSWECECCGQCIFSKPLDALPGKAYTNATIAQAARECFVEQMPLGKVARRFEINKGTLIGLFHDLANKLEGLFRSILNSASGFAYIHADETGWSMDGKRAYVWIFANHSIRIFLYRKTRASAVPREIFGVQAFEIIVISDRYTGYSPLNVQHQYCYAHLLREVKSLKLEFPEDREIELFCDDLMTELAQAMRLCAQKELTDQAYYAKALNIKVSIMKICTSSANHPGTQKIQNIFREKEQHLFHWVELRGIPCENNFAERNLRPVVIARKISFGSQSERGMRTREIITTVLHTVECCGINAHDFCKKALDCISENRDADLTQLLPVL